MQYFPDAEILTFGEETPSTRYVLCLTGVNMQSQFLT